MKEDRRESNEQESDSSFTSREQTSENIRTVREHQRTSEQSENIRPTTVRTFKLSPIEMKSENKKLLHKQKKEK